MKKVRWPILFLRDTSTTLNIARAGNPSDYHDDETMPVAGK